MWDTSNNTVSTGTMSYHEKDSEGQHSVFGDGRSVLSRGSTLTNRFHDEPEADYDQGATALYRFIENKDWDAAKHRLEMAPEEARTWVSRREPNSNKTRWRLLPLHAVCIFRAPLALIEALIEIFPDGPQMKDDQGMLPVHLACRNGASKGVVLTLLSAFPESLYILDRKKRSLQDLIQASSSVNKDAVFGAMQRFEKDLGSGKTPTRNDTPARPQQAGEVNEVDYENRTMLFRHILKKDWKAAAKRAIAFPEEAATWIVTKGFNGNLRFLPLHKACVLQPPDNVITALLDAYEGGAKDMDQDGWLPIHCACFYGASGSIIDSLLGANSKGAQAKDDEGRLPLHYACLKGASQEVVDLLVAAYVKGAMSKDEEGRLPVHHACSKGAPESVIDALLKASPKGAQSKDDQGRLPLHHACRKNASERVIRTLLRVYPRAAQIKDDQEKLSIHYACQHGATSGVITFLLTTYPESVNSKNGFGSTPLDEAKALDDPKMDAAIKVLTKFRKDQNKLLAPESSEMEDKLASLEYRVATMEKTLGKVSMLGKDMRNNLRKKKDSTATMEKFFDELIYLGSGRKSRSKSPLKGRNSSTPGGGLFGRHRSSKSKSRA